VVCRVLPRGEIAVGHTSPYLFKLSFGGFRIRKNRPIAASKIPVKERSFKPAEVFIGQFMSQSVSDSKYSI
jgi:hypothetical protein